MSRRNDGEGSWDFDEAKGTWRLRVTINGRRRSFKAKTKRKALAKAAVARRKAGDIVIGGKAPKLSEWLDTWLETVVAPTRRARTVEGYSSIARLHIVPQLGFLALDKLQPGHIRAMLAELTDEGLSPRTVRNVHAVLRGALETARRDQIITWNPASAVSPPTAERAKHVIVEPAELGGFLEAFDVMTTSEAAELIGEPAATMRYWHSRGTGPVSSPLRQSPRSRRVYRFADVNDWLTEQGKPRLDKGEATTVAAGWQTGRIVRLILALGLRRGEALGLRWDDIDEDRGELWIRQSLQRTKTEGLRLGPTKTHRSERPLPLLPAVKELLRQQRRFTAALKLKAGPLWGDEGFVFTAPTGGPIEPRNFNRAYGDALGAENLRRETTGEKPLPIPRVHDLRHSAVSYLRAKGVSDRVIMEVVGHSRVSTTSDLYGVVLSSTLADALSATDEIANQ